MYWQLEKGQRVYEAQIKNLGELLEDCEGIDDESSLIFNIDDKEVLFHAGMIACCSSTIEVVNTADYDWYQGRQKWYFHKDWIEMLTDVEEG